MKNLEDVSPDFVKGDIVGVVAECSLDSQGVSLWFTKKMPIGFALRIGDLSEVKVIQACSGLGGVAVYRGKCPHDRIAATVIDSSSACAVLRHESSDGCVMTIWCSAFDDRSLCIDKVAFEIGESATTPSLRESLPCGPFDYFTSDWTGIGKRDGLQPTQ